MFTFFLAGTSSGSIPFGSISATTTAISATDGGSSTAACAVSFNTDGSITASDAGSVSSGSYHIRHFPAILPPWLVNDTASGYFIYFEVSGLFNNCSSSVVANTWYQLTRDIYVGALATGTAVDITTSIDVFVQRTVSNPGTNPTIADPAGATYLGNLSIELITES